ncbi:SGNH/GDSL hydrolase family protein [Paenarthrobacter sp. NPDC057981]|uniref:SGNH/GDSL hydrolase family protein n=1 Tax=Paenarthrobacter sp. NPDC057981 TaxID=3346297 RepID=UPI0036DE8625
MAKQNSRSRIPALVGGLAIAALTLGFTAAPATAAPPPPLDYVALGDSYTAGTGADGLYWPDDETCWQSEGGYVDLVAATGRVHLVANAACHGAFLVPLGRATPISAQLAGLIPGSLNATTDLVSITAGALDAGSGVALQACSTPGTQLCAEKVAGAIQDLQSGALLGGLALTYQTIQDAAPDATIAVLGYPRLFDPAQGDISFRGVTVVPVANQILVNQAIDALNATIAKAVRVSGANAVFVDMTKRFLGHAVNSGNPWLQLELTPVLPETRLPDANFHPNDAGHQAYASALLSNVKPTKLVKQ